MLVLLDLDDAVLDRILSLLSFREKLRFRLVSTAARFNVSRVLHQQQAFALCMPGLANSLRSACAVGSLCHHALSPGDAVVIDGVKDVLQKRDVWLACADFLMCHCPNIRVMEMPSLGLDTTVAVRQAISDSLGKLMSAYGQQLECPRMPFMNLRSSDCFPCLKHLHCGTVSRDVSLSKTAPQLLLLFCDEAPLSLVNQLPHGFLAIDVDCFDNFAEKANGSDDPTKSSQDQDQLRINQDKDIEDRPVKPVLNLLLESAARTTLRHVGLNIEPCFDSLWPPKSREDAHCPELQVFRHSFSGLHDEGQADLLFRMMDQSRNLVDVKSQGVLWKGPAESVKQRFVQRIRCLHWDPVTFDASDAVDFLAGLQELHVTDCEFLFMYDIAPLLQNIQALFLTISGLEDYLVSFLQQLPNLMIVEVDRHVFPDTDGQGEVDLVMNQLKVMRN